MAFHLPTLLWFMGLTSFTMAAAVLVVGWRSRVDDGLLHWGVSLACHGLTYPLFALRLHGWLEVSIITSCIATSATFALNIRAVSLFQRDERPPARVMALWLPILATAVIAVVTVNEHQLRNVLVSLIVVAQAVNLASLVVRRPGHAATERSRVLLVAGVLSLVVLLVVRSILIVFAKDWSGEFGVPVGIQAGTYFIALMILLLNTVGFLVMQKDKAVEAQHVQAVHDPLTGIYNRRALMDELERLVRGAVRDKAPVSLLMIDIDRFKQVNDTYGHLAGDEVLSVICERIARRLRHGDLFARFGGEEFVVVLPNTRHHDALVVAEAVREVVGSEPIAAADREIPVTVSIGVQTQVPNQVDGTVDQMIGASDRALYRAKAGGRNRVEGASEDAGRC